MAETPQAVASPLPVIREQLKQVIFTENTFSDTFTKKALDFMSAVISEGKRIERQSLQKKGTSK